MKDPVLIIHGGAGRKIQDPVKAERIRKKLKHFAELAFKELHKASALETACFAVQLLENDPDFNAGTGARLQADGAARLSAAVMNGKEGRFAGVINIENIKNPVLVAKRLLDEEYRVLAGKGAFDFAIKVGFKKGDPRTPGSIQDWKDHQPESSDTVGACVLDRLGRLACATSTGGRGFETAGRVSDSAMPVATYADTFSAVSCTGVGEQIMEEGLALRISTRVRDGLSLQDAFAKTFLEVKYSRKRMGAIGVDASGNLFWQTSTEELLYAFQTPHTSGSF